MIRFLARIGRLARETHEHWNRTHGSLLSASVSFYACFCIFPVLLILLSAFGFFLQNFRLGQDYQAHLHRYLAEQTSPEMAVQLQDLLVQIEASSIISGPVGFIFLLMTALTLFVNFERCLSLIWGRVDRAEGILAGIKEVLVYRMRGFLVLLGISLLILLNFCSYFAIEVASKWFTRYDVEAGLWQLGHLASSLVLNSLLFTLMFHSLPRSRVFWRHALQGGIMTALTWEIGRYVLAWFVISDNYHAYGVVGVFMGLMMWAYYGSYVILFGATITRVAGLLGEESRRPPQILPNAASEAERVLEMYRRTIRLDEDSGRRPVFSAGQRSPHPLRRSA